MKKLLLLLGLGMTLALSSCTTEEYYTGMDRIIEDFIVYDDPYPDGWGFQDGNAPHFYYNFNFDKLTDHIYDNGTIVVYYDDGQTQHPLPYVRTYEQAVGGYIRTWTQTIDYEFRRGGISFYVTNSDFIYNSNPGRMKFRMVVIW